MTTNWSIYQQAVFDNFETGTGHTVVQARAGSGKTTTILEAATYISRRKKTLLCAFNKEIARELQAKAPRHIEVRTLHSAGLAAWRSAYGNVTIDERKTRKIVDQLLIDDDQTFKARSGAIIPIGAAKIDRLVGAAKNTMTEATNFRALQDLALERDCHMKGDRGLTLRQIVTYASAALRESAAMTTSLDYDDMIYMPAHHQLRPETHDRVIVDETQDLNAGQLYLVQALCRPNGRIVAVGDDRQACYAFRGADHKAMARMIEELDATVLPLSITYRCPRRVVELAQKYVPDLTAHDGAAEGSVEDATEADLMTNVRPGDFIISRTNAPLLRLCLRFLTANTPACIRGRDIGRNLITTIESAKSPSATRMVQILEQKHAGQIERLTDLGREAKVIELQDRMECIEALADGFDKTADVIKKIEGLFRDDDPQAKICLTSTHRAKGLERDTVWLLRDTYLRRRKNQSPADWQEEENLYYVAITRAKQTLRIVEGIS